MDDGVSSLEAGMTDLEGGVKSEQVSVRMLCVSSSGRATTASAEQVTDKTCDCDVCEVCHRAKGTLAWTGVTQTN